LDDKNPPQNLRWTQVGEKSFVEWNGQVLRLDTLTNNRNFDENCRFLRLNNDLWIFETGNVAVWRIDGDIPDENMYYSENSIAILGKNAVIPKVLALKFSAIIALPNFETSKLLLIMEHYNEKVMLANDNSEITFKTDGVSWYFQ